ncbi:MAG TPA: VIT1/CCC1 transporter family protein [Terriglobales bacterium]
MPSVPHVEKHFTAGEVVRDIVIGMADGLTVPFALAAGLTGAIDNSHIVVTAGLAEIAAGSIAMGLGGFLAARGDAEHYNSEREREFREVREVPDTEADEITDIFQEYGVAPEDSKATVDSLRKRPKEWVDFMMRFELGLEKPNPSRARNSAATIAGSYIAGGLIPLSPYFLEHSARAALWVSVALTLVALFLFGLVKGRFTGLNPLKSATQTVVTGGLAAAAAFLIARWIT